MDQLLFLSIDRSLIGDWRAAQVFQACRAYALHISPGCLIRAKYVDHERVGWHFQLRSTTAEAMLLDFYTRITAGAL